MKIEFYKKGQGYYTRLCTAMGAGIMVLLGCWALYNTLDLVSAEKLGTNTKGWIRAGVPAAIFVIAAYLIFRLINSVRFADFLIQTEGEMKKVSWSTRKEIFSSTKIVIITVIIMAAILALVDMAFHSAFVKIGVLKG